jgi:glycosyl hydrolase family 39 (putative alpha-L-iduronidase)
MEDKLLLPRRSRLLPPLVCAISLLFLCLALGTPPVLGGGPDLRKIFGGKKSKPRPAPTQSEPAPQARQVPGGRSSISFAVPLDRPSPLDAAATLRTSVVTYQYEEVFPFMWDQFFKEQRVGTVLIEPKWQIILPSTSMDDLKQRMRSLDPIVMNAIHGGGSVLLMFQCVPKWISSQPDNNGLLLANQNERIWYSVPPKSWDDWSSVVQAFVQHFNRELATGGHVSYMIGSEPENYWKGSEDDFFKYYQYAVKGALAADPGARLGGITPAYHLHSHFNTTNADTKDKRPLLQNWIRFCKAQGLPIHFVTWHSFPAGSPLPTATTQWAEAQRDISGWLAESGYRDAELIVADWPDWKAHPEGDTEVKAAWTATGLIALLQTGPQRFTYLGIRDAAIDKAAAASQATFGGGNGLFTRAGIIKPVYNVFRLTSRMEGKIVPVDTQDDFVKAVASVDGGHVWLLLSNFLPPDWLLPHNMFRPDAKPPGETGELPAEERKKIQNLSNQAVAGRLNLAQVNAEPYVKSWLTDLQDFSGRTRSRRGQTMQVTIQLQGMAPGAWHADEYVIDAHHANTFASLDRIKARLQPFMGGGVPDSGTLKPIVGQINAEADVLATKHEIRVTAAAGAPPSIETTLEPNAVHLIELTPAAAGR